MMTPADEMEYIIKEIVTYENNDIKSYTMKTFPEIYFIKYSFYYLVEIFHDHHQNDDIIERFEEFRNELGSRKITIENQIVDINRKILFHGNDLMTYVPIYYKDCRFTSSTVDINEYCENCIAVKD